MVEDEIFKGRRKGENKRACGKKRVLFLYTEPVFDHFFSNQLFQAVAFHYRGGAGTLSSSSFFGSKHLIDKPPSLYIWLLAKRGSIIDKSWDFPILGLMKKLLY